MKLNSNLKQKFLRTVIGGALIAGLLPVSNAFAVATFPTSGSCAMLITPPAPVGAPMPTTIGYNVLAVLTLTSATAGTIDFNAVNVAYTGAAGGYNVAPPGPGDSGTGIAVTIASLAAPAAGKSLTFSPSIGKTMTMNAIAVNGGSTILIQGVTSPLGGVCQF